MLLINASTAITKCFFFETIQMGAIISKKLWTQLHSPRNPEILLFVLQDSHISGVIGTCVIL